VRHVLDGANEWQEYELKEEVAGNGLFKGTIPKEKVVAGTLYSYFRAQLTNFPQIKATAPTDAPTYVFITAIKARPYPWIAEFRGPGYDLIAAGARIRRLKANAEPSATVADETISPVIKKPMNLAKCAVIPDPRDGGVWVPHFEQGAILPVTVRFFKYMPDGSNSNALSQFVVSNRIGFAAYDPVRDRLWLAMFRENDHFSLEVPSILAVVNIVGAEITILNKYHHIYGISVDFESGDTFLSVATASGTSPEYGIFRVKPSGQEMQFTKLQYCRCLVALPNGELVCLSPSGPQRIVWFDASGNEKYSTKPNAALETVMDIAVDASYT
jgi:hypothetical protein